MRWRPTSLRWNSVAVTLSLLTAAVVAEMATTAVPAVATGSGSAAFSYTGSNQSWTVPSGVTSIGVDARGGQGGGGLWGGPGGRIVGTVAVTPGETLTIIVGGTGSSYGGGGAGGYGGGGGGGGASDVRQGGTGTANRIMVAGGGGGTSGTPGNFSGQGGAGGASVAQAGTAGCATAGAGGTQSAGGAGGTGDWHTGGTGGLGAGEPGQVAVGHPRRVAGVAVVAATTAVAVGVRATPRRAVAVVAARTTRNPQRPWCSPQRAGILASAR